MKRRRLSYKCFIALNQEQTLYPEGLRRRLQVTAPMKTSKTAASAAPAPHSRATDEEEAEEGEQRGPISYTISKIKKKKFRTCVSSPAGAASRVWRREAGSGRSSGEAPSSSSRRIGPRATVPSHCRCGGKPAKKTNKKKSFSKVIQPFTTRLIGQLKRDQLKNQSSKKDA